MLDNDACKLSLGITILSVVRVSYALQMNIVATSVKSWMNVVIILPWLHASLNYICTC